MCCQPTKSTSPVCLVNLLLSHPRAHPDDVEAADEAQALAEHKLRASGEHTSYSTVLVSQLPGPVRRIVIPIGHIRKSTSPLFQKGMKCPVFAREVDFARLRVLLGIDPPDLAQESDDDLPLDVLAAAWS